MKSIVRHPMAPTTCAASDRAASQVFSILELWALIAEHCELVRAFRVMLVCRPARQGRGNTLKILPQPLSHRYPKTSTVTVNSRPPAFFATYPSSTTMRSRTM